ncbi:P-loop ATPase, Sll1717 family [Salinicoccus luteus]|uniref:P-loop ATPase, Sll1717 family n=1 Tax=Salinicoccus luteus TaxID=367840 RepID=UPI0004E0D716|nr:hypothetical protein [Salinicoccus luteus]
MPNEIKLKDLFVGDIDGEVESTREDFEQLFYTKNSKFNHIINSDRFIISGRKGTGKTILSQYIFKQMNKRKGVVCKIFTRHDFKLQQLIDLQHRSLQRDEINHFWKWLFLIQLGKSILEIDRINKWIPFTSEYKLKQFYSEKYPENLFRLNEYDTSKTQNTTLKGQKKLMRDTIGASIEDTHQTNKSFIKTEYYELISLLEKMVLNCMKKNKDSVLIYDDLDELEDRIGEDSSYYKVLISMLETIKTINLEIKKTGRQNSKIIVVLRSDIIDDLHKYSSNSNKLTTGSKTDLYWISKNYNKPEEHPLMEMLLIKIKNSVPAYKGLDNSSLYKRLFPRKIENKEVIDYLLNYSFGRPRDIIRFLTLVMESFPNERSFHPSFFKECAQDYSKWFYNELENEISISKDKDFLLDSLRLINDLKKRTFDIDMIEDFFLKNQQNYANITDLKLSLKKLYKYGVIGNSWIHRRRPNKNVYHYAWGYRDDADNEPNFSQSFVVHYGLRKFFSL